MLFLGGTDKLQNYSFDIEKKVWAEAGNLPQFHLVTETITLQYFDQTITLYVQVNFDKNCFQIMSAANKGFGSTEWEFIFTQDVDIDNFHIKCATIYKDTLIIFARGKPRDVKE